MYPINFKVIASRSLINMRLQDDALLWVALIIQLPIADVLHKVLDWVSL